MKKVIFIALSAFVLFSCKKDKLEPQACTTSTTAIAGPYKVTTATYKASATAAETDYYDILLEPCEKDDVYTFKTDGTYQIADIGLVCSPSGSDVGTWALSGNTMTIDGDPTSLESFDCKTLVLVNTDIDVAGDRVKITLTKQ